MRRGHRRRTALSGTRLVLRSCVGTDSVSVRFTANQSGAHFRSRCVRYTWTRPPRSAHPDLAVRHHITSSRRNAGLEEEMRKKCSLPENQKIPVVPGRLEEMQKCGPISRSRKSRANTQTLLETEVVIPTAEPPSRPQATSPVFSFLFPIFSFLSPHSVRYVTAVRPACLVAVSCPPWVETYEPEVGATSP